MNFGIQLFVILFSLGMAYVTYTHYKRREFRAKEILFWMILWAGFIFVTVLPQSVDFLVRTFRFSRRMDFVMIAGFFVLFVLAFRNYYVSTQLEDKLERLVRDQALKGDEKNDGGVPRG